MPLLKHGEIAADPWRFLGDDESLPAEGPVVVSLERWEREADRLRRRPAPLGLRLKAGQHPAAIAPDVGRFTLIALDFPKFTDGRAYSYARHLRERLGFAGELRATGQVLRDQLLFMHRCGFDAFEIAAREAAAAWHAAQAEITLWYQPTADGRPTIAAWRQHTAFAPAPPRRLVEG